MNRFLLVSFSIFIFTSHSSFSQNKFTISGFVQEESTGESLIGVSVFDKQSLKGTTSNEYGFYSITLDEASDQIIAYLIDHQLINS